MPPEKSEKMRSKKTLNQDGRCRQRSRWRRRLSLLRPYAQSGTNSKEEGFMNDNGNKLTLSSTKTGKSYTLVGFDGGQQLREKIYSMGLNSGAIFTIISNPGYGPVGLEVRQTRLGIGRGMAAKIKVREVET
jgi:ferrous iron transport protein A